MALLGRRTPAGRTWRRLGTLAGAWLALVTASPAVPAATGEYQIKAVFLFHFAQFVDWPADAFPAADSPLVIGVLGQDPFGPLLDEAVSGERIDHRPLQVKRFRRVDDIEHCHVLFISRSESSRMPAILRQLAHRSILTVSDADGFETAGGMIRLLTENHRVRLRIDPEPAHEAGLTISSKLLRPAEVVNARRTQP